MIFATVDPKIAASLALVESSGNQWALRFEPAMHARGAWADHVDIIARIVSANHCSIATAQVIFCTSFGRYQIMGGNLYSRCMLHASVGEYMASPDFQDQTLSAFLGALGFNGTAADLVSDPQRLRAFALFYNGPGNVADYSARLLTAIRMTAQ